MTHMYVVEYARIYYVVGTIHIKRFIGSRESSTKRLVWSLHTNNFQFQVQSSQASTIYPRNVFFNNKKNLCLTFQFVMFASYAFYK